MQVTEGKTQFQVFAYGHRHGSNPIALSRHRPEKYAAATQITCRQKLDTVSLGSDGTNIAQALKIAKMR
jgi:hypothetical protein